MAQKITLRKKIVNADKIVLYLDYYPPIINQRKQTKTRREFFNKFLIPDLLYQEESYIDNKGISKKKISPVLDKSGSPQKRKLSQSDILHNKEAISFAEKLLLIRRNHYNKQELYNPLEKEYLNKLEKDRIFGDKDFINFFVKESEKRKPSTKQCWNTVLMHLKTFFGEKIKFSELTVERCDDFKNYLLKDASISQNTASLYYTLFKTTIKQAYNYDYIKFDINKSIKPIKQFQSKRNHLTLEELQTLANTPCHTDVIKRAALFSAQTGLRFSDIEKLTWENVIKRTDGFVLDFRQQKHQH